MTTGHVFIATSFDGFIARKDHSLDWLMKQEGGDQDHGYVAFMESVDGIVMGANTFRTVLGFDVAWPYIKPVLVVSTRMTDADIPGELKDKVRVTGEAPKAVMEQLHREGWRRVYVDGGSLVQAFLRDGLIADMTVTLIPILIGEGIRLFGALPSDIDLELVRSRTHAGRLLQVTYRVL